MVDSPEKLPDPSAYSQVELRRNRRWNGTLTCVLVTGVWAWHLIGDLPRGSAILGTLVVICLAILYRVLFASSTSVRIHEDSPGLGKRIHPRTLGTILGYLNDGFKR